MAIATRKLQRRRSCERKGNGRWGWEDGRKEKKRKEEKETSETSENARLRESFDKGAAQPARVPCLLVLVQNKSCDWSDRALLLGLASRKGGFRDLKRYLALFKERREERGRKRREKCSPGSAAEVARAFQCLVLSAQTSALSMSEGPLPISGIPAGPRPCQK